MTFTAPLHAQVRVGADQILEEPYQGWIRSRRIGLITNQTGVTSQLESLAVRLQSHSETELVALFAPEHGLGGQQQDGRPVQDGPKAFSLYPEGMTADRLADVDVLLYDIQDVGARFYTFISTLLDSMKAAAAAGIPFIVLDRPNPLGGMKLEGPVLEPGFESFVGVHPIPVRYALTPGELARLYRLELDLELDLRIVPLQGWQRSQGYEMTGLEWIAPSPNMPSLRTARVYGGMAWIEGTNLSEGRGTTRPFELVGAPWLDHVELARRLNARSIPGARWRPQSFTPTFSKYSGELCRGVQLHVIDVSRFSAPFATLSLLEEVRKLHPEKLRFREQHFDRLAGNSWIRTELMRGASAAAIAGRWRQSLEAFRQRWRQVLLYPPGR